MSIRTHRLKAWHETPCSLRRSALRFLFTQPVPEAPILQNLIQFFSFSIFSFRPILLFIFLFIPINFTQPMPEAPLLQNLIHFFSFSLFTQPVPDALILQNLIFFFSFHQGGRSCAKAQRAFREKFGLKIANKRLKNFVSFFPSLKGCQLLPPCLPLHPFFLVLFFPIHFAQPKPEAPLLQDMIHFLFIFLFSPYQRLHEPYCKNLL